MNTKRGDAYECRKMGRRRKLACIRAWTPPKKASQETKHRLQIEPLFQTLTEELAAKRASAGEPQLGSMAPPTSLGQASGLYDPSAALLNAYYSSLIRYQSLLAPPPKPPASSALTSFLAATSLLGAGHQPPPPNTSILAHPGANHAPPSKVESSPGDHSGAALRLESL